MSPADIYNACGYCSDWMPCEKILWQCIEVGYNSAQWIRLGYSSAQCIKIRYSLVQCIRIGYSSVQCIKIWNRVFSALCDTFRHSKFFRFFFEFLAHPRPQPDYYSAAAQFLRLRILIWLHAMWKIFSTMY